MTNIKPRLYDCYYCGMNLAEKLISFITPFACLSCGQEGNLICKECQPTVRQPVPSRCYRCHTATISYAVCERCRRESCLKHVWASTELAGLSRKLLLTFKFERAQAAAPLLAGYMNQELPEQSGIIIVPIPTATNRLRARGYDHTKLLANELAKLTGLRASSVLSRSNQTRQVGTKRDQRLTQLKDAFWTRSASEVRGAHILLVDDVVTTGATLEEAAKALRHAGAKRVDAVVFAQR
jgi:competence protein ComFC